MDILRRDIAIQRAGVAAEIPGLLRDLGVPAEAVFGGTGIDPSLLTPDARIPLDTLIALVERAARVSAVPDFGLRLGLRFRMEFHGPIGALMVSAPTLGVAMTDFVTWQRGYSSGAITYVHPWGDDVALGFALCAGTLTASAHFYDAILGVALRMVEELTGGRVRPVEAHLCHRAPAAHTLRAGRVPLRYDQPRTCVILPGASRDFPLPGHDPARRAEIAGRIAAVMEPYTPSTSARVRGALRKRLMFDSAVMADVAGEMQMHPRTLRRHLADEGTTFEHLRDDVRLSVARELLTLTDLDVGEIAAALAFASPGVFSDSFRRVQGTSPSVWRRQLQETA
jgi:AraC-like DNA-binding protein